jgi:hypothetical protein
MNHIVMLGGASTGLSTFTIATGFQIGMPERLFVLCCVWRMGNNFPEHIHRSARSS